MNIQNRHFLRNIKGVGYGKKDVHEQSTSPMMPAPKGSGGQDEDDKVESTSPMGEQLTEAMMVLQENKYNNRKDYEDYKLRRGQGKFPGDGLDGLDSESPFLDLWWEHVPQYSPDPFGTPPGTPPAKDPYHPGWGGGSRGPRQ